MVTCSFAEPFVISYSRRQADRDQVSPPQLNRLEILCVRKGHLKRELPAAQRPGDSNDGIISDGSKTEVEPFGRTLTGHVAVLE